MARIKIEDIRDEAIAQDWELISTEYKNLNTELEYKCDKGHPVFTTYKKIRNNYKCPLCKEFNGFTDMSLITTPIKKSEESFRILALDQSTKITGYAIFDNTTLIKYGTIEIGGSNVVQRLLKVREWVRNVNASWKPDLIVIEDIQMQSEEADGTKNVITFKILAMLIGVLQTFFEENGINYEMANISKWRQNEQIKGKHRTDKKRSAMLRVEKCYNIKPTDDEADAILIGRYMIDCLKEKQEEENIIHWD